MKRAPLALVFLCTAISVFGQKTFTLDEAIKDSANYFIEVLEPGTEIAVMNFSASPAVSNYVIADITAYLVNSRKFSVITRDDLELRIIRKELNFQLSSDVDDKSAKDIGHILGLSTIILGKLDRFGNMWKMEIKALEAESGDTKGMNTYIVKDPKLPDPPKPTSKKIETGALNIIFGLGSYLEGDIAGGLTITAGYAAAAGLFAIEALALDRENPAAGVPATIGVITAGLTLVYGFGRPFIYNPNSSRALAFLDSMRIDVVPASGNEYEIQNISGIRLSYTVKF
jgi:hypothetical protein